MNLGAGFEITIRELAEKIGRLVGYQGRIVWDQSKPDGQPRRRLDTSRARAFDFHASMDFDEGLSQTIAWWQRQQSCSFNWYRISI